MIRDDWFRSDDEGVISSGVTCCDNNVSKHAPKADVHHNSEPQAPNRASHNSTPQIAHLVSLSRPLLAVTFLRHPTNDSSALGICAPITSPQSESFTPRPMQQFEPTNYKEPLFMLFALPSRRDMQMPWQSSHSGVGDCAAPSERH
jgi:hypothetical protein